MNINDAKGILLGKGMEELEKELFEKYKKIPQNHIESYSIRSTLLIYEKRYYEALDILHIGLGIDSNQFDLLYNTAYTYEQLNEYGEAIEFYKKASILNSDKEVNDKLVKRIEKLLDEHEASIIKKCEEEEEIKRKVTNEEYLNKELMKIIKDIEAHYPVEEWVMGDVHIWSLIRNTLYGIAVDNANKRNTDSTDKKEDYIHQIKVKKDSSWLEKKVDAVFLSRAGFRSEVDGVWYSRFCDPIADELENMGLKTLSLDYLMLDNIYRYPEYRPAVHIQQHLNYVVAKEDQDINLEYRLEGFNAFLYKLNRLREKTKLNIFDFSIKSIAIDYIRIRRMADYFKAIFYRVKPKLGFVSVFQNYIGYAFCLACKECGVTSVDISHGPGGENSIYLEWNKLPKWGYELLPNYFWSFDNVEASAIKKWTQNKPEIYGAVDGGDPWIEMCLKDDKRLLENINKYVEEKLGCILNKPNCVNILFAHTSPGVIPNRILDTIERSPSNWNWFIRFHPMTPNSDKNRDIRLLGSLKNSNLEYKYSTELPLLGLLNFMDMNINLGSSTTYEAMSFGVPSIILYGDEYYRTKFKMVFDKKLAIVATEEDNLLEIIEDQAKNVKALVKNVVIEPKIKSAVEEILKFSLNKTKPISNEQAYEELLFDIGVIDNYVQIELCIECSEIEKLRQYYTSITNDKEKELFINYLSRRVNGTKLENILKEFI
ncbi:tetratricopeptide repeat protein [Clostridium paridis]|uniref:Tetratricopeptide repeat protein n=1 Tax=Clostridium paridis TaxID=2803863 RepID=A0A937FHM4_9CLOT|nr:tetratricopeptide repeat protein [Clostridium paridis]MBL4933544.1 tetratricopeptide repeat protein [Clostridium paridis]